MYCAQYLVVGKIQYFILFPLRTEKEQEVKAKSYDDWLSNKKAKEQKKLRKQKDEMETKRLMEDDK